MSNIFMRSLLVVFLVLTLIISSASLVSANCYVTAGWCSSSESDACTLAEINAKTCKTITGNYDNTCFFDPEASGMIDDCTAVCCCDTTTKTYETGSTKGICVLNGKSPLPTLDPAQCAAQCASANSITYSLSGFVKYNNQPVANVQIKLSDTYTSTTTATGYYSFPNVPSGTYVLSTSAQCGYNQNIVLDSTKTWDINLQCVNVKISGYTKNSAGTIIPNAEVTLDLNGNKQVVTSTSTGYYEFSVQQNSKITLTGKYTSGGTQCTGTVPDITLSNVDMPNRDIVIECSSYAVNVNVEKSGSKVTDASVFTNRGQTAQYSNGFYPLNNIYAGPLTITATKEYISSPGGIYTSTTCTASSSITLSSTSPPAQTVNLYFDDSTNCCTKTITYSSCTNGFMDRITRYSGSCANNPDGTPKADERAPVSCTQPLKPCEWNCQWSTCTDGELYSVGTCTSKIQTADCDMSLPTPLPRLTRPCPGNELCGNGEIDGSETCDYNIYTQAYEIADSCANQWINVDPSDAIRTKEDIFSNGLMMSACNLYDCSCATPQSVDVPIDQCRSNPSTLKDPLVITNFQPTSSDRYGGYKYKIAWEVLNSACTKFVDHYELRICNNNGGDSSACANGDYKIIDENIDVDTNPLEYIHDGSPTSSKPKILPNTQYCYKLTMEYTDDVGLGAETSVEKCFTTGDAECMVPHESNWCLDNGVVFCRADNTLDRSAKCQAGQTCWFSQVTDTAACMDQEVCGKCEGVFGLYSYMGYNVPTEKPIAGSTTNKFQIFCPSNFRPAPNPDNTGKSANAFIFGCYLDYSKTTIDGIYACEDVKSCYDYTSEASCEQDYCGKFTVTGDNGCEWNEYVTGSATKNSLGKGVCAPKDIEAQDCMRCTDQDYNRLGSACTADICQLYGKNSDGTTSCYFDSFSQECWNKGDVTCDMYMDEKSCNGATATTPGQNVFTNVKWLNDDNNENTGNYRTGAFNSATAANTRNPSNDGAGVGVCKWVAVNPGAPDSFSCIRDADNSYYSLESDCRISDMELNAVCNVDTLAPITTIDYSKNVPAGSTPGTLPVYGLNMNLRDQVKILDDNPWPVLGDEDVYKSSMADWRSIRTLYCVDESGSCYPTETLKTSGDDGTAYIADLTEFDVDRSDNAKTFKFRYYSEDPARNLELIKSMDFKIDALEPTISLTYHITPKQVSLYQWISDVDFILELDKTTFGGADIDEQSVPVQCTFTLTPLTPAAALTFAFNGNDENNMPSLNNPVGNILYNTDDQVIARYYGLSDGLYGYEYSCVDNVGNIATDTGELTIDGDVRISDPQPYNKVYKSNQVASNQVDISVKTSNPGICRYSQTEFIYDRMPAANAMTYDSATQRHTKKVNIPATNPSGLYKYYVSCELTDVNNQKYVVPGNDADSPFFSIDDLAPTTTLMFKDPNSQPTAYKWTNYAYDASKVYDGIVVRLNCSDSNVLLTTATNTQMTFGCEDTMYYCIPYAGVDCYDTDDYIEITADDDPITLSYGEGNSPDKEKYGNAPSIFYFSKDKGGNIENFRITKLNVRNTHMNNPIVSFVPSTIEFDDPKIKIVNGIEILNNYHAKLEIKYEGEKSVTVDSIKIFKITDNSEIELKFDHGRITATDVIRVYDIGFIPSGTYRLVINSSDDDGNSNGYNKTFGVNHSGNEIRLNNPRLGIGKQNPYQFSFLTKMPSTCKYGFVDVNACNYNPDGTYSDTALDCWFRDSRYIPITKTTGFAHDIVNSAGNLFDDGHVEDFISPRPLNIICKINNYDSNKNDAYIKRSVHYGHLTVPPKINLTYILDPVINDPAFPNYNVIINENSPKITISIKTDQLSVCRINLDHQVNVIDLINQAFDNETNADDFSQYKLDHTYTIDYTDTGFDQGDDRYEFEYNIDCTNLAQLKTETKANVVIDIDRTPPVASLTQISPYFTRKEFRVGCTDHCTNAYEYKVIGIDETCTDDGFSAPIGYENTIDITSEAKICVKVKDVLGRYSEIKEEAVQMTDFNIGSMKILVPYEYSRNNGNNIVGYYNSNTFELTIWTGPENEPIDASCAYGINTGQYADLDPENLHEELYEALMDANREFANTGVAGGDQTVHPHTQPNFKINVDENTPEAWVIICKAFDTAPGDNPYISREVFFYWDSTLPSVNIDAVARIYDWNNRLKTNITIITDDDTMCTITDSTSTPAEELVVDNGQDDVFESYKKTRVYSYTVPSKYSQYLDVVGDITLEAMCTNMAKESFSKEVTIRYEIDKQVDATSSLDTIRVFGSRNITINATTDIMSTCSVTIDGGSTLDMSSTNRIYHTRRLDLTSGRHTILLSCRVPENNNIGKFTKQYEVFVDMSPPTVQLIGPDSYNGPDTTCNIDGFTVNVVMSDADSSIESYEYTISGDGITPNYVVADSGNLNNIFVPPQGSVLKNNRTYTINVQAKDLAGNVGGSSITVRTFNPVTGVTCDHLGPQVTINTAYHTSTSKNFAVANLSCADAASSGTSSLSSGCSQFFKYSFVAGLESSCSGATYEDESAYDGSLIFFEDKGTLCIQAKDLAGNPTNAQTYINISPITCGNGVIEKRLQPGYFGLNTRFDNWDWDAYASLPDEKCDGSNLAGETCISLGLGFVGGTLSCSQSTCGFDTSQCTEGMNVELVSPQPFGIGSASSYTTTVHSEYESQCRYGLLDQSSNNNIVNAYNGALMNDMTRLTDGSRNHERNIGPLSVQENYVVRYAVCKMTDTSIAPTEAQQYGILKLYEGFDTSTPQITSITTDKPNDKINDFNNREIAILVTTNEDTICKISDSINTVTDYTMYGYEDDYNSYSRSHTATIDYSDLSSQPAGGLITLTVECFNKAGLSVSSTKNIYYDISTQITIEKISPPNEYITGYLATFAVKTNILSQCYVSNGTVNRLMDGTGLQHEKALGIGKGWNSITVTCSDPSPTQFAYPATATYRVYGGANMPIGMNIDSRQYTCSLSGLNAKLSATKTTLDIAHYSYTVTDLATSVVVCAGNSQDGNLACSASIVDGRNYIIEAFAVDTNNQASEHAFAVVMGSDASSIACDLTNPVVSITKITTGYNDFARLDVQCTDSGTPSSGCKPYYHYDIVNAGQSCAQAQYTESQTRAYGIFDIFDYNNGLLEGTLCIKGSDNNDNLGYANYSLSIGSTNYINIVPMSGQVSPKYVPLKVIATLNSITDLDFRTDVGAVCKYSTSAPTATDSSVLYNSYAAFTSSTGVTHKIEDFNTQSIEEQFIDVICFAATQPVATQYSRASFIVAFVNETPNVTGALNPNNITDWFDRSTQISSSTNTKTICTVTTNDGQHDNLKLGDTAAGSAAYARSQYATMYYDVNTYTPSTYYYIIECKDYLGRTDQATVTLEYNLPTTLEIEILSPLTYSSPDINIIAATDIISNCTLTFNGSSRGLMYTDLSGKNHISRLTNIGDGKYAASITCTAPIRNMQGTKSYNITINTTVPPAVCGDGIAQKPNSLGRVEDCDGLDLSGKSCTSGFVSTSWIGGQLRCKSDCTFDFINCDNGKGWCGNGEVDGPNSNNVFEQCDGSIPSGLDCSDFGFKGGGRLSCSNGCMINTSLCLQEGQILSPGFYPTCNNNQLESGEQCEINGNNTNIFCKSFGYDYGTVSCSSNCQFSMNSCVINTTKPTRNNNSNNGNLCGNGRKDNSEECDRSATGDGLFTTSCKIVNASYSSGTLGCNAICKIDYGNCTLGPSSSGSGLCTNGVKDSSETDVDCGGSCGACALDKTCITDGDCVSDKCELGKCVVNTCANTIFDAGFGETDVDCGGAECDGCEVGKKCSVGTDCESGYCVDQLCAQDPCSNGLLDAGEADIDCGGSCVLCSAGSTCTLDEDCSSGLCEEGTCAGLDTEPEKNPAKAPLIWAGLISMLGSGGYILYRTYYSHKPTNTSRPGTSFSGLHGTQPAVPQRPTMTPEQQRAMLERQREALLKKRQQRNDERKSFMEKLGDSLAGKTETKPETSASTPTETKASAKEEDEFVELKDIKGKKDKDKTETFNRLKEIGKGHDELFKKAEKSADGIDHSDALKMFGKVDRDIVMSKAFREVLSKLLSQGRISKENVSKILFEYMDKGMITKAEVAKISAELKII